MAEFNLKSSLLTTSSGSALYHILLSFPLASECSPRLECQPQSKRQGQMTGKGEIRKYSRRYMWVEGKRKMHKNHRRTTSQGHSRSFPSQKVHLPICKYQSKATTKDPTWLESGSNTFKKFHVKKKFFLNLTFKNLKK